CEVRQDSQALVGGKTAIEILVGVFGFCEGAESPDYLFHSGKIAGRRPLWKSAYRIEAPRIALSLAKNFDRINGLKHRMKISFAKSALLIVSLGAPFSALTA